MTNGFLAMGSEVVATNLPISSATASNNAVSALGRDLKSRDDGELRYQLTGTAPNQVFIVQWKNYRRTPTLCENEVINFQIQLYETVNVVAFAYGFSNTVDASTARTVQVGLRGSDNTDFNNRSTSANWTATTAGTLNNASCWISSTVYPPNGLFLRFTPGVLITNGHKSIMDGMTSPFYDSGGPSGQYQNSENYTFTFSATNPTSRIYVLFAEFSLETNWDFLKIYNGPNNSAQQIGPAAGYTGANMPAEIIGSNSLTFVFTSDGSGQYDGWAAIISAVDLAHDLSAQSIVGSYTPPVGTPAIYSITIKNNGANNESTYTVKLMNAENVELVSIPGTAIAPQQVITFDLTWIPLVAGQSFVYGKVVLSDDRIPQNDKTTNFPIEVQAAGTAAVTVGAGGSTGNMPINFYWKNSLFQTVYLASELNIGGLLTDIQLYNTFQTNLQNKPTNIWIGETNQTDLSNGWIPSTQLTQVFNGTVDYPSGSNNILIHLSTPYSYGGGNLVVMVQRPMDTQHYSSSDRFVTQVGTVANRTLNVSSDGSLYDPAAPPMETTGNKMFPKTTFKFITAGFGSISGNVTSGGSPLPGATVTLAGTLITTTTSATGTYVFPYAAEGVRQISATKHGFNVATNNVTVVENQTVTTNLVLAMLPQVTVSGRIVGNDQPTVGLAGATISLSGFESYSAMTNNNGHFTINDVFANQIYDYTASFICYQDAIGQIVVGPSFLNMEDITINELNLPPVAVQAILSGNNVNLTWMPPGTDGGGWITWCQDVLGNGVGTNSPVIFDVAHRYTQTDLASIAGGLITKIKFVPNYLNCVYTVKVWTGGSSTSAGNLVSSQVVANFIENDWNLVVLDNPVPVPAIGDLYVGFEVDTQGDHPAGCDNGPVVEGKGNMMYFEGEWTTLTTLNASLTYNWSIKTFVADGAAMKEITLMPIPEHQTISYAKAPLALHTKNIVRDPQRFLTGFDIWRLLQGQENNESAWVPLTSEVITARNWQDEGWGPLPGGTYKWAVKAVYGSRVASIPTFSNTIIKHYAAPIKIGHIDNGIVKMNNILIIPSIENIFYSETTLTYSILNNTYLSWELNPDRTIVLTPETDWHGQEYITIRATDPYGQYAEQIVKVTVLQTSKILENFNHAGALPSDWTQSHSGTTSYPWQPYLEGGLDYGMKTMATTGGTVNERLVSREYDMSTYKDIQVSFDTDFLPYGSSTGTFAYSLNNLTYVPIASYNSTFSGNKKFDLPVLTGKPSVRFRWTYYNASVNSGQANHWIVDDFQIFALVRDTDPPAAVTGFMLQALTSSSATLAWNPSSDQYFDRYELYISTDDEVTTADQLWTISDDPLLNNVNTSATTLSPLVTGNYWVAIRAVDLSGNHSELSEAVTFFFDSSAPIISDPIPVNQPEPLWAQSHSVVLGCTVTDDSTLDYSTLAYRVDYNGNGNYDGDETWTNINTRKTGNGISRESEMISFTVTLNADGIYAWEVRVADLFGNMAYSGSQGMEGIADDWIVRADATPPSEIDNFFIEQVWDNSIQLTWSASSDQYFSGYRIYYSTSPDVSSDDMLWDQEDDPALQYAGSDLVTTTVTGLIPSIRYYFLLQATDEAGWITQYTTVITGMTTSSALPQTPQNMSVTIQGIQVTVDWDDVTQDIQGNPIGISYYEVHIADQPYFECSNETLLATVESSQIVLDGLTESVDRLFFKIIAVSGAIRSKPPMAK